MTRTLVCITEEEPMGFHDGMRGFSVRLSFATDAATEADAKTHFTDFLQALKNIRIIPYALQGTQLSRWNDPYKVYQEPWESALASEFVTWLGDYGKDGFFAGAGQTEGESEKSGADVDAHDVVLATAGRAAPLPQKLHLALTVRINPADDMPKHFAMVPLIDGLELEDTYDLADQVPPGEAPDEEALAGQQVAIAYQADAGDSWTGRCSISKAVATPGTLVSPATGFCLASPDSPQVHHLLQQMELRAGSLFTGYLAVQEVPWKQTNDLRLIVRRLAWQAVYSLACALDTVLLALNMPGRAARDGTLLSPYLDLMEGAVRAAANPQFAGFGSLKRRQFRAAIRAGLKQLSQHRAPTDVSSRRDLVNWLRSTCSLDPDSQPDAAAMGAANERDWLTTLLHGYIHYEEADAWNAVEEQAKKVMARLNVADSAPGTEKVRVLTEELERHLAKLYDSLTGEAGMEAVVVRLLGQKEVSVGFADYLAALPDARPEWRKSAEELFGQNVLEFKKRLAEDAVDGAHAARTAAGSLLADLLLMDRQAGYPYPDAAALRATADKWQFWYSRFRLTAARGTGIAPVLDALIHPVAGPNAFFGPSATASMPDDTTLRGSGLDAVRAAAQAMQDTVLSDLFPGTAERFCPDLAPRPLTAQIAVDIDADDEDSVDDFAAAFSGMALLIRRAEPDGAGTLPWAYGNLGEFVKPETGLPMEGLEDSAPIVPLPTTVSDGRRNLFAIYRGVPFSSAAFNETMPKGNKRETEETKPFFRMDYPETPPVGAPLPPLAYGHSYELAAHAIGKSGSLPSMLQDGLPWRPTNNINLSDVQSPLPGTTGNDLVVFTFRDSRTTRIGPAKIVDGDPLMRRIGVAPEGVRPLSVDYPRIALAMSGPQVVDVFRNSNGRGAVAMPLPGDTARMALRDLYCWSASNVMLQLMVMQAPDAMPESTGLLNITIELAPGHHPLVDILVERTLDGGLSLRCGRDSQSINVPSANMSLWLRMKILSPKHASISLADSSRDTGREAAASRPIPADLLLLGNASGKLWQPPYGGPTDVAIKFPRVGYEDFERWTNDSARRKKMFSGLDDKQIKEFLTLLLSGYIGRTVDRELADLLEQLPDPAVIGIRLCALPLDGMQKSPAELTADSYLGPVAAYLPVPRMGLLLATEEAQKHIALRNIKGLLHTINKQLEHRLKVQAGDPDAPGTSYFAQLNSPELLHLPAGMCVLLTAQPLVPVAHFQCAGPDCVPVIDPHQQQLALEIDAERECVVFGGASLRVEGMLGPLSKEKSESEWCLTPQEWAAQCTRMVMHEPAGMARSYDLTVTPKLDDWHWRQIGSINVATQRWRFMGRPIYAWFKPREAASSRNALPAASLKLKHTDPDLHAFEVEAFDGRDPKDDDIETALLEPGGARSTLLNVVWEKPSASLFRHRFTLRSRYQAAMENSAKGQCNAWDDDRTDRASWLRVVMLAEMSRITLNRPQLRALIPLTMSPEDAAEATPPVLAFCQERPFDYGGLADRYACEIKTGIGYHFNTTREKVEPLDARKEIGRDPGLSYVAFDPVKASCATLSAEGPIGLTKDPAGATAPAFANSAVVLHTEMLAIRGKDGDRQTTLVPLPAEEHFVGVTLRRYLDPHWLVTADTPMPSFDNCWWMEFDRADASLSLVEDGQREMNILECTFPTENDLRNGANTEVSITVNRIAIDASVQDPKAAEPWKDARRLVLAVVPVPSADERPKLALLHNPLDKSRASLSVFWIPPDQAVPARGAGALPVLIGSVEWTIPAKAFPGRRLIIRSAGNAKTMPVSISAPTTLQWVRMQRNFDNVLCWCAGEEEAANAPAKILSARLTEGVTAPRLHFFISQRPASGQVWLLASTAVQPVPLHLQRHLAALFSRILPGPGRTVEMLTSAYMLPAKDSLVDLQGALPDNVRLVELELPAAMLGHAPDQPAAVPPALRFARFDLTAIGFDRKLLEKKGTRLSFCARLVASQATHKDLQSVDLKLRTDADNESDWVTLRLSRATTGELHAFYFDFDIAEGRVVAIAVRSIDRSGVLSDDSATEFTDGAQLRLSIGGETARAATQGLTMHVAGAKFEAGRASAFWLEIGMLASTKTEQPASFVGTVDFDWLFGTSEASAQGVLRDAELQVMCEAQARVIAVSPPIRVEA